MGDFVYIADGGSKKPMRRRSQRVQRGLTWSPRISMKGNFLHPMINHKPRNLYKGRIPQNTYIDEDLPYKERSFSLRNKCQIYTTIKTTKPSQTKVCIIYPSFGTLELWKFSDLTFGWYLAVTTLLLSARSSLFLFHRFYLKHVRTVRLISDFWHHQFVILVINFICFIGHKGLKC